MRVWLALGIVYVVWGSTYLGIRVMVETVPPLLGSGARFFVAGLIFAAWVALRRGPRALRVTRAELGGAAFVGVALLLGGNGLVSVAEQDVPSGLAALVIASIPLWVVVLRRAGGERIGGSTFAWVALGFAGVAMLMLPGERPDDAPVWGVAILVGAALCWATGSYASGRLTLPADPLRSAAWQMLCGGGTMIVVALLAGEAGRVDVGAISTDSALALAYLVVFGSLVAFTAYTWLLQHAPLSLIATYAYVNPVVAILLGAVILSEELTPLVLVAATVIVVSVAGTIRAQAHRRVAAVADAELGTGAEVRQPG
jgi:drug/metabolite transporter (DMT)-like permease